MGDNRVQKLKIDKIEKAKEDAISLFGGSIISGLVGITILLLDNGNNKVAGLLQKYVGVSALSLAAICGVLSLCSLVHGKMECKRLEEEKDEDIKSL